MYFFNNKFVAFFLLCTIASWSMCSEKLPRSIYITRNSKEMGPFYRQGNTNVFLAGTNNAVGLSATQTHKIIMQIVADTIPRYQDSNYNVAVMINFKRDQQYSIHEYRIPKTSDEA